MKKYIALIIATIMLFALAACKSDKPQNDIASDKLITITQNETVTLKGEEKVFPENTVVTAKKIEKGDIFTKVDKVLKKTATKFEVYDITALCDKVAVQPNGTVKATFDIPADFNADKVAVVYISDDGKTETLASTVDKSTNTVTAELKHFSLYAVIEVIVATESNISSANESEDTATSSTNSTPSSTKPTSSKTSDKSSKPSTTTKCTNAEHYALLAKKVLTCPKCGKTTKDATNPNPAPTPTTPKDTELYRLTYNAESIYITFDVWKSKPKEAMIVSFSGCDDSDKPYKDGCTCSPNNTPDGYSFDLETKTVTCPCGKTSFKNPEEFLDFTCTHEGGKLNLTEWFDDECHEYICSRCNNWLYPIREKHKMDGNECTVCEYKK